MKARISITIIAALGALVLGVSAASAADLSPRAINAALDAAYENYRDLKEGKNADYIPALAKVDPAIYGIALVTTDGKVYTKGDVGSEVSIQSISKVFTMAKVIEEQPPARPLDIQEDQWFPTEWDKSLYECHQITVSTRYNKHQLLSGT